MQILSVGNLVPRKNNMSKGFSLLELLVVMAIVGMMAALVVPRLGSNEVTFLKVQIREAMAVLNYARRSAIVEGKAKVAIFHEGNSEASSQKMQPGQWTSRGATLQWKSGVTGKEDSKEEMNEKEKDDQGKKDDEFSKTIEITFYPEGGSSGGELLLSYHEHQAKIIVDSLTGKVRSDILDDQGS